MDAREREGVGGSAAATDFMVVVGAWSVVDFGFWDAMILAGSRKFGGRMAGRDVLAGDSFIFFHDTT